MIVMVDGPAPGGAGRHPGGVLLRRKRLIKKHRKWVSTEYDRRRLALQEAFFSSDELREGPVYLSLNLRDCVRMTVKATSYTEANATLDLSDRQSGM